MSTTNTLKYRVEIEEMEGGYAAHCPDVPGCFTVAETTSEIMKEMHEALTLHLECMLKDGEPIPRAGQVSPREKCVEVTLPAYMTA